MGVLLTPIVVKEAIALADLRGRRLAVDAHGELYQFLALILGVTRTQLIDIGLLVGTDFHAGVKGTGPKKALHLVTRFGAIEHMPPEVHEAFGNGLDRLREIYLEPPVDDHYSVTPEHCDVDGVVRFLCDEHAFNRDRIAAALERAFRPGKLF